MLATGEKSPNCSEEDCIYPVADNYFSLESLYSLCSEEAVNMVKIPKIPTLCLCGCNEIVWKGNKYIKGHNPSWNKGKTIATSGAFKKGHTPWNKGQKVLQITGEKHHLWGKHHTDESKKKMSESGMRFSTAQQQEISKKYQEGQSTTQLANTYNTSTATIWLILIRTGAPIRTRSQAASLVKNPNRYNKENIPWNKGIPRTEEQKKKQSVAMSGRPSPRKGVNLPEDVRIKISKKLKNRQVSEEFKENLSRYNKLIGKKPPIMWGGKNPNWNGGTSFLPYCHKFNENLKEQIRERDDRTCQLCGVKENDRKLDVHHIHYDKPNCEPDLIALCRSCNGKVNSNRDYYEVLFMENLKGRGFLR